MDIIKLCMTAGAYKAEEIPIGKLILMPEMRELCEQNACGCYGRNYTCPPYVGEVEKLSEAIKGFQKAVLWQNIYPLKDSFDIEGMTEARQRHNTMTMEIAKQIYERLGRENCLVLAAGSCSLCKTCAALTDEPCRFPDNSLPSLEAYLINVAKTVEFTDLKYINGANTVTYFSGAFTGL